MTHTHQTSDTERLALVPIGTGHSLRRQQLTPSGVYQTIPGAESYFDLSDDELRWLGTVLPEAPGGADSDPVLISLWQGDKCLCVRADGTVVASEPTSGLKPLEFAVAREFAARLTLTMTDDAVSVSAPPIPTCRRCGAIAPGLDPTHPRTSVGDLMHCILCRKCQRELSREEWLLAGLEELDFARYREQTELKLTIELGAMRGDHAVAAKALAETRSYLRRKLMRWLDLDTPE